MFLLGYIFFCVNRIWRIDDSLERWIMGKKLKDGKVGGERVVGVLGICLGFWECLWGRKE